MRPGMLFKPDVPRNGEPRTGWSMGEHAEAMARTWGIAREAQDALALRSHQQLMQAYERGFFNDLMTPFQGVRRDNNVRPDLTLERLAGLKPVFDRKIAPGEGTLTAGNSTPLTDGASTVLLASEAWAAARGLPVLAYLTFSEVAAVDFLDPAEGLLMAPVHAVSRLLSRAAVRLQDFDYYEIHEAFAAQALGLPSEIDLAREARENVDPDILFAARMSLRAEIGRIRGIMGMRFIRALPAT